MVQTSLSGSSIKSAQEPSFLPHLKGLRFDHVEIAERRIRRALKSRG